MKKAIGLSLAAVMAMSLTACGGGKSDAPAAGTQAAGSEAAGSEAAGAEGDTIKLGVIGPLTGPAATYGNCRTEWCRPGSKGNQRCRRRRRHDV